MTLYPRGPRRSVQNVFVQTRTDGQFAQHRGSTRAKQGAARSRRAHQGALLALGAVVTTTRYQNVGITRTRESCQPEEATKGSLLALEDEQQSKQRGICGSGKFQADLRSARGGADHQDWVARTRSAVALWEKGLGAECLLHRGCSVMREGSSFIYES